MPNLTIHMSEALLRAAKVHAARRGTSISEIVRQHLTQLAAGEAETLSDRLRRERSRIDAMARQRGLRNVRVFGSVARGEESEQSDVDILVDAQEGTSLLGLVGFKHDLEELLGRRVDVVTADDLDPAVRERALAEATPL